MKKSSPLTAGIVIIFLAVLILGNISCSNQPSKFRLIAKFGPTGKVIEYKIDSHRVGSAYKNGELVEDFDVKVEGEIIYTAQKVLDDGQTVVLEENVWSWDELVDDTGQVKRITRDYAYKYQVSPSLKITELKMLGKPSQSWEDYVRSFNEQGLPIFPDKELSAGESWTQTTSVLLPDSQTIEVSMTYTIKGIANKQGYDCAIIDYKGNLALPLFPDPADSMSQSGVDWIEMNGIMYFAIEAGVGVNYEERRRVVSERNYIKGGEMTMRKHEFEAVISQNLVKVTGG